MAFTLAAFCYLCALLAALFCMFCVGYTIMVLVFAFFNDEQSVLPEYAVHFSVIAVFFIASKYYEIYWNLPLLVYHIFRYTKGSGMRGAGLYHRGSNEDVMPILINLGKFGFYLISAHYYLYAMIYELM